MHTMTIKDYAEAHAAAIARGDLDAAVADLSEELRPNAPAIAAQLPSPVETALVESVDDHGEHAIVRIAYSGGGHTLRLRSRWEPLGGRPMIVDVTAV